MKVFEAFRRHKTDAAHRRGAAQRWKPCGALVELGNGVALVPALTVERELKSGALVRVPVKELADGAQAAAGASQGGKPVACRARVPEAACANMLRRRVAPTAFCRSVRIDGSLRATGAVLTGTMKTCTSVARARLAAISHRKTLRLVIRMKKMMWMCALLAGAMSAHAQESRQDVSLSATGNIPAPG